MNLNTQEVQESDIFLFQRKLRMIRSSGRRAVYIQGGKGMGKTVFLGKLREETGGENSRYFSGKQYEELTEFLTNCKTDAALKLHNIYIDDLDQFIRIGLHEGKNKNQTIFSHIKKLNIISGKLHNENKRLYVTGRLDPSFILKPIEKDLAYDKTKAGPLFNMFFSKFFEQHGILRLNPWEALEWKSHIQSAIQDFVSLVLGPADPNSADFSPKKVTSFLFESVIEQTGGHPTLIGMIAPFLREIIPFLRNRQSFKNLQDIISTEGDKTNKGDERGVVSTGMASILRNQSLCFVREILERLKGIKNLYLNKGPANGLSIKKTNYAIDELELEQYHKADESLIKIAEESSLGGVMPAPHYKILSEEGLVYSTLSGYAAPCALIKREILLYADRTGLSDRSSIHIQSTDDRSGQLFVTDQGKNFEFFLKGKTWLIFNILAKYKGKFVKPSKIMAELDDPDEERVRTALWRLRKKLEREFGFDVIRMDWGKGYQISDKIEFK